MPMRCSQEAHKRCATRPKKSCSLGRTNECKWNQLLTRIFITGAKEHLVFCFSLFFSWKAPSKLFVFLEREDLRYFFFVLIASSAFLFPLFIGLEAPMSRSSSFVFFYNTKSFYLLLISYITYNSERGRKTKRLVYFLSAFSQ